MARRALDCRLKQIFDVLPALRRHRGSSGITDRSRTLLSFSLAVNPLEKVPLLVNRWLGHKAGPAVTDQRLRGNLSLPVVPISLEFAR